MPDKILEPAVGEFNLTLDELETSLRFARAAIRLRPRLNEMIAWNGLGVEAKAIAQEFMKQRAIVDTFFYRGMLVVLSGAFEQLIRRIVRDTVAAINVLTRNHDLIPENIRLQNIYRTGQALATIFEPPDHLLLNYQALCKNIGTCLPGVDNSALNADAFTIYISTLSPKHLVDTLRRIGVNLDWDDIGRLPDIRRVLEKRDTRETAKAAEQYLRDFVQKRNRIAHCGSGGLVVTDGDIERLIEFFRVFSRSLAGIVEARIADTVRGRD